jgi:DNA-binding beta-propeller fold protein YncE
MRLAVLAAAVLATAARADDPKPAGPRERVLPGLRKDGFVQLPNQWALKPAGKQVPVGDLPVNVQLHPTGQFAAVLHCGFKTHEVAVLDLNPKQTRIVARVPIAQGFYGLAFSPDGKQLYASGGEFDVLHVWDFDKGLLHNARTLDVSAGRRTVPAGVALSKDGREVFATGLWANALVRVPLDNPGNKVVIPLTPPKPKPAEPGKGEPPSPDDGRKLDKLDIDPDDLGAAVAKNNGYPYTVLLEPGGKRAFVSLWSKASVAVVDLESNAVTAAWPTASHPTEMALAPDGKTLYVSCANSTQVSVLDPADGTPLQTIVCSLYPQAPAGNTPNSLTLTPDGQMLFVANADANNLAVFNVADRKQAKPLGFVPTGWYPTSVRFNPLDKTLYVANGKGLRSDANRTGPNPERPARDLPGYIGALFEGTLSVIPVPTPDAMTKLTKTAYQCSPLLKGDAVQGTAGVPADNPIPRKLGDPSPIKHVIYVVKENRTYDQVFGDLAAGPNPKGNGEPELCLFPRRVTPNHHKLAEEFVLLDNTYVDGEVSADGHEWSMGAYATDFVEKLWPLSYRGSPKKTFGYPAEGAVDQAARPAGGYLWDRAKEAGVSYRNYGEWVTNGKRRPDGSFEDGVPSVPALIGHFDPKYRGYDLDYPDVKRAEHFAGELKKFEAAGEMPRLQILRIGNDHTSGTRVGKPTPRAMVADNDLALGMMVEAISKSRFWKDTAVFVIEDDAQNGPDHVDAHRVVALVVSPYTKRKFVDSDLYSTTSMLRTMELILGLKPMSQFDAAARPMFNSFQGTPDATPYTHLPAEIDLNEKNKPDAWGAAVSAKLDLDEKEDQADDLIFNEIIWKSVKGPHSPMPAPVRAAFFVPRK